MKLRKRKLFSSIAFVLSLVMLAVSGAIFVHSAQQQSVSSSLQVTYDARNVNFTADAWYEKPSNSGTKQAFADNTLTINATAAESTTSTLSVTNPITLNANPDTYVLFTYKFVNTASNGGYDMLVSLTDDATKTNVNVKYLTSITADVYTTLSSQRTAVVNGGSTSVPAAVCVPAQSTLYYYVLVEIDDNTLGSSYVGNSEHKIIWSITSANTKGATMYSVSFDANGGSGSMTSQSYTSGTQQALSENVFTNGTKTFLGWNTAADGTGISYTDEQALTLTSLSNGAQIVLYAVWEEVATLFTISFDSKSICFFPQIVDLTFIIKDVTESSNQTILFNLITAELPQIIEITAGHKINIYYAASCPTKLELIITGSESGEIENYSANPFNNVERSIDINDFSENLVIYLDYIGYEN